ncbi:DNA replication ATP-dependent helicase/nuclease JHS1 [Gastrolobium bilobum]|uniref:DNA replication ATP-dependent helicase/nuclease JHS1 n=1 Tax=Gastrolobium bilobum TaxID=150636 RepID=UPI002AB2B818|nr:DNA replication ATP-dependent helicase/nuclease JHS1 [Gastrolobium bilobum]
MPPRKKPNSSASSSSSSKKPNLQPSKFGIQHFFDRHTLLTSQKLQANNANPNTPVVGVPTSEVVSGTSKVVSNTSEVVSGTSVPLRRGKPNDEEGPNSQNTPPENSVSWRTNAAETLSEVSPEMSKSLSLKRFKFSPGMFVKQSQDDGVDEVTWKISPMNERLQSVSKHMPNIIKALADSSRINFLPIRSCSEDKANGKVEKFLTSPTPKASAKSLVSTSKLGLKRINPGQDADFNVNATIVSNSGVAGGQSPFRTPPSLSYSHDKLAKDIEHGGPADQLYLRQHKKALLELLDQVEDAISVDNATVYNKSTYSSKSQNGIADKLPVRANHAGEVVSVFSNTNYLVLEVSDKRRPAESSAAQCPYKVLRLLNEQTGEERAVNLWDEWSYSVIAPGDTVNIIGQFDEGGNYDINHDNNFLIIHPDILVSGTRVAASFSCPRRTVLDERLKYNEYSIPALTGTLLHQIFQAGLTKDDPTVNFLEDYTEVVVQRNIESLYACGVNENDVHKTLIDAIPRILSWIMLFKNSEERKDPNVGFDDGRKKVSISEVIDIEEMAWAPKYGLKGMIDASVRVKVQSRKDEPEEKIMPIEFKTGKTPNSQSSVEHSAQVILYTLLMSERYQKAIDSGLLYYLQSDQTQGIMVQRSDLVGLIMRRNELASDILKALTLQQLPPMLQSPSICRGCRHLNVCSIYHKADGGSTKSSGLGDMFDSHTNHLTSSHSKFLCHWDHLIDLEAKETELLKKGVWRSHSLKGLNSGGVSSVVLDASQGIPYQKSLKDNRFIYRFVQQDTSCLSEVSDGDPSSTSLKNNLDLTLRSGDYVILSNESSHQTIAKGVISDVCQTHVSVSFSKRLRIPGRSSTTHDLLQQVWRIDKDEVVTSFAIMRFNLVQLFLQNDQTAHLRRMIVDLEAPRFDSGSIASQDPAISYVWSEKSLNDDQRRAILKILTAKDYALILGMPGTGKTSTMVHAVKALLIRGTSILLTAYTNSAVDNLLIKLKAQGIDFLRIGRHEAVNEEVRGHCLSATNVRSVEDIKRRLEQVKVVAFTCLGISSPLLANMRFDVCIMDEAGQTTLPVSLGPLTFASMFVLVGDHYQLPPIVQSTEARENGMGISLFCRLSEAHPQAISALQSQYRMCQGIMDLSNALIYGDRLRCGSSEVANAKLEFSGLNCGLSWLEDVLNPGRPVIFIDTDQLPALEARDQKNVNNPVEAHIIAEVAKELVANGIGGEHIGIITPYNSQANLIRHAACITSLEIHTIDKYQGRDKDCILVSFVRSSENPTSCVASLLGDWRRINVALTRAKRKLIMVGSRRTLLKVPLLKLLIKKVEEQSGILSPSKKDIYRKGELKRCSQMR